jgi:NADH-quinone oxidoreductase subunit J
MDELFFWLFAAGMIGFGLAVVLGRNPVASALCFATTMVFMAALFVMLNAFFLAAVQILVTAGAVMVLFLFIIMLLDVNSAEKRPRQRVWMACTLVLALGFVYLMARVLDANPQGTATADSLGHAPATIQVYPRVSHREYDQIVSGERPGPPPVTEPNDDTHQIGRLLFTRYVAPFEVTSLLILVATIGVVVLCKEPAALRRKTPTEIDRDKHPETGPALTRTR